MKSSSLRNTPSPKKRILFLGGGPIVKDTILGLCKDSQKYEIILLSNSASSKSEEFKSVTVEPLKNWVSLNLNYIDVVVLAWRFLNNEEKIKINLIKSLLKINGARLLFIHLSSVSVYGQSTTPSTEVDLVHPINMYGIAKLEIEKTLQTLSNRNILSLRISNVFGHFEFDDFINRLVRASKGQHHIKVIEPRVVTRDFIEIGHVIQTLSLLIENHSQFLLGRNLIMNLSSGKSISLQDVLELATEIFKVKVDSIPIPEDAGLIIESQVSNQVLKSHFPHLRFDPINEIKDYLLKST